MLSSLVSGRRSIRDISHPGLKASGIAAIDGPIGCTYHGWALCPLKFVNGTDFPLDDPSELVRIGRLVALRQLATRKKGTPSKVQITPEGCRIQSKSASFRKSQTVLLNISQKTMLSPWIAMVVSKEVKVAVIMALARDQQGRLGVGCDVIRLKWSTKRALTQLTAQFNTHIANSPKYQVPKIRSRGSFQSPEPPKVSRKSSATRQWTLESRQPLGVSNHGSGSSRLRTSSRKENAYEMTDKDNHVPSDDVGYLEVCSAGNEVNDEQIDFREPPCLTQSGADAEDTDSNATGYWMVGATKDFLNSIPEKEDCQSLITSNDWSVQQRRTDCSTRHPRSMDIINNQAI